MNLSRLKNLISSVSGKKNLFPGLQDSQNVISTIIDRSTPIESLDRRLSKYINWNTAIRLKYGLPSFHKNPILFGSDIKAMSKLPIGYGKAGHISEVLEKLREKSHNIIDQSKNNPTKDFYSIVAFNNTSPGGIIRRIIPNDGNVYAVIQNPLTGAINTYKYGTTDLPTISPNRLFNYDLNFNLVPTDNFKLSTKSKLLKNFPYQSLTLSISVSPRQTFTLMTDETYADKALRHLAKNSDEFLKLGIHVNPDLLNRNMRGKKIGVFPNKDESVRLGTYDNHVSPTILIGTIPYLGLRPVNNVYQQALYDTADISHNSRGGFNVLDTHNPSQTVNQTAAHLLRHYLYPDTRGDVKAGGNYVAQVLLPVTIPYPQQRSRGLSIESPYAIDSALRAQAATQMNQSMYNLKKFIRNGGDLNSVILGGLSPLLIKFILNYKNFTKPGTLSSIKNTVRLYDFLLKHPKVMTLFTSSGSRSVSMNRKLKNAAHGSEIPDTIDDLPNYVDIQSAVRLSYLRWLLLHALPGAAVATPLAVNNDWK